MPKRTCARICLTDVSCQLNTRKATSKSRPSDEMLDVWVIARPNEVDTEAAVTLEVGQNLLFIFTNEVDADGSKPDRHFDGHAAENSIAVDEIEAMEVFKQFGVSEGRQCQRNGRNAQSRLVHCCEADAKVHVPGSYSCQLLRRHR